MPLDKQPGTPPSTPPTSVIPPQMPASAPTKKSHQPVGPFIGIFIIVGLLLVGALYFWGEQLNKQPAQPTYIPGDSPVQQ